MIKTLLKQLERQANFGKSMRDSHMFAKNFETFALVFHKCGLSFQEVNRCIDLGQFNIKLCHRYARSDLNKESGLSTLYAVLFFFQACSLLIQLYQIWY